MSIALTRAITPGGVQTMTATVGGLVPTPPNDPTKFLSGDGTWDPVVGGVSSFNTRTGGITLTAGDVTTALTYTPANPAGLTMTGQFMSSPTNMSMNSDGAAPLIVRNVSLATGDAGMSGMVFLAQGTYGIKMGIRADGYFGIGGYSRALWSWYTDPAGNMTTAGNVTAYSDPRLKENVKVITGAVDLIKQLDGVFFDWRHGFAHTECKAGKNDLGILADQVEAIFPQIVYESIEIEGVKYKTVAYDKLVPVLIEAVKEQQTQIDELKVMVQQLLEARG